MKKKIELNTLKYVISLNIKPNLKGYQDNSVRVIYKFNKKQKENSSRNNVLFEQKY